MPFLGVFLSISSTKQNPRASMRRTQSLLFLNFRSSGEIKAANARLPSDPRGGELFVLLAAREAQ